MTSTVRRSLRKASKAARRGAPAAVAVLILAGLLGSTLAGALSF